MTDRKVKCSGRPTPAEFEAAKATLEAWLRCNFEDRRGARGFIARFNELGLGDLLH